MIDKTGLINDQYSFIIQIVKVNTYSLEIGSIDLGYHHYLEKVSKRNERFVEIDSVGRLIEEKSRLIVEASYLDVVELNLIVEIDQLVDPERQINNYVI